MPRPESLAGGDAAGLGLGGDVVDQWHMALGKIGGFHRPVIHLDVDVVVIVGGPCGLVALVPEALEVGGQATGTGATGNQIAAVLEECFFEIRITGAVRFACQFVECRGIHRSAMAVGDHSRGSAIELEPDIGWLG